MAIPESQLETWSGQGAVITAKNTHASIRKALSAHEWPPETNFEVYLQGSYKNSTNIRGDSDVDIIAQLNSTFGYDLTALTESEKNLFQQAYPDAKYQWSHFRADVVKALRDYYGVSAIDDEGNKSLKVSGDTGRLPSDVVVALHYRKYEFFQNKSVQSYVEGIRFYALREKRWIINFPNVHYDNGVEKNAQPRTNGWYKRSVRMFKNARTSLVDKGLIDETLAPSYFLECLLYNVPDRHFGKSYQETFLGVIGWILNCFSNGDYHDLLCQNEQLPLFGATPEQWSLPNAVELLKSLVQLWEDW